MTTPTEAEVAESAEPAELIDPRAQLAEWANANDEWVRLLVAEVIATGRPVETSVVDKAYLLFRQEKALDKRELPAVPLLNIEARQDESAPPLSLTALRGTWCQRAGGGCSDRAPRGPDDPLRGERNR